MPEHPRRTPPATGNPPITTAPDAPGTTVTGVPVHGHRPVRPALVIAVFCLGLFMTLLDITIVNIAIPDLVTDLTPRWRRCCGSARPTR